jgi:signal transduction histidine kinase
MRAAGSCGTAVATLPQRMVMRAYALDATANDLPPAGDGELFERLVHDLRNPLGVMAYFAESIPSALPAERDEFCERLLVNAQRALQVLADLALLADLRAGRIEAGSERCDVTALLETVAVEIERFDRCPERIRRQTRGVPQIDAAPAHVACVLRLLLRAALLATGRDETVELIAAAEPLHVALGVVVHAASCPHAALVPAGIERELIERVAALYRARCAIELRPRGRAVTLLWPAA